MNWNYVNFPCVPFPWSAVRPRTIGNSYEVDLMYVYDGVVILFVNVWFCRGNDQSLQSLRTLKVGGEHAHMRVAILADAVLKSRENCS